LLYGEEKKEPKKQEEIEDKEMKLWLLPNRAELFACLDLDYTTILDEGVIEEYLR
jgi:hypothetical protein